MLCLSQGTVSAGMQYPTCWYGFWLSMAVHYFPPLQLTLILQEEIRNYPAPHQTSPPDLAFIDDFCLRMKNDSCLYWDGCRQWFFNSTISFTFRWWHPYPPDPSSVSIYSPILHKGQLLHSYFTQWIIIRYCVYFFWCSNWGPWQPL